MTINRSSCDIGEPERAGERMCWHTRGGAVQTGFRCGDNDLNGDAGWERLVYMRGRPIPDECRNYAELSQADRSVGFNDGAGGVSICDRNGFQPGWYRFTGEAGTRMPVAPPETFSCGTDAPGWLNGQHPPVEAGATDAEVCFNWGNDACLWRSPIQVRNCGDFYVYQVDGTPDARTLRYCGEDPFVLPPVGQHTAVGVIDRDQWTVCRADPDTAWLAADSQGHYNAVEACASLGYHG